MRDKSPLYLQLVTSLHKWVIALPVAHLAYVTLCYARWALLSSTGGPPCIFPNTWLSYRMHSTNELIDVCFGDPPAHSNGRGDASFSFELDSVKRLWLLATNTTTDSPEDLQDAANVSVPNFIG